MNTFTTSSLILAFCKIGSFSVFVSWQARIIDSIKSNNEFSILCPKVYLSFLGNEATYWYRSLYKSYDFWKIGTSRFNLPDSQSL